MADDMRVNPQRARDLLENLASVTSKVQAVNKSNRSVRVVLVSKLKPATDILALHQHDPSSSSTSTSSSDSPQIPFRPTHFGENYFQELSEKASLLPRSIKWHFIGALQSNKCKPLAEQIPNLWCVSSVDSEKKADQLEKGRKALVENVKGEGGSEESSFGDGDGFEERLRVMVQVNTSGEESKSGVEPSDASALCKHILTSCPHLRLSGLMTIGAIARSQATTAETENEDFIALRDVRDQITKELGSDLLGEEKLELSMGMSGDFEGAIAQGSDEVRIGSTIFGERPARKDAVVKEEVEEGKK